MPASLVLISPAIGLHPAAALATWKRRLSLLPGLGRLAWLQVLPEFDPYKYNSFTTNAGEQVHRLTLSVAGRLESRARSHPTRVLPPTLVLKSNADATVSTDAVVDRLLGLLDPHRHELVLFDINRFTAKSIPPVSDPRALTTRVMGDHRLPFAVTLVTNENPKRLTIVARRQAPFSAEVSQTEPLDLAWPPGVISLSRCGAALPAGRISSTVNALPTTKTFSFSDRWPFRASGACSYSLPTGCCAYGTTRFISTLRNGCWPGWIAPMVLETIARACQPLEGRVLGVLRPSNDQPRRG